MQYNDLGDSFRLGFFLAPHGGNLLNKKKKKNQKKAATTQFSFCYQRFSLAGAFINALFFSFGFPNLFD